MTEDRYINVTKLSNAITKAIELSESMGSHTNSRQRMVYADALQRVNRVIKEQPSADVQPVVHAKWKTHLHSDYVMQCSNCKKVIENGEYDFCPYCGAKMDGDENG